ncbi:MAG: hypothetical protein ACREN8_13540, partial [Candidatus Dormibacteraceae bacterium]
LISVEVPFEFNEAPQTGSINREDLSASSRAEIQFGVVAQREELQLALARALRERWREKRFSGLARDDRRSAADWLEVLSHYALRSVGEEHEADRQFALTQLAAAALSALESSHRQHGELRGVEESPS